MLYSSLLSGEFSSFSPIKNDVSGNCEQDLDTVNSVITSKNIQLLLLRSMEKMFAHIYLDVICFKLPEAVIYKIRKYLEM